MNLGVPHGISGIILLLLSIKEKGHNIDKETLKNLFGVICHWEFVDKDSCYFPSMVYQDGKRSKSGLTWCYGDLMIGYAMLKYANLFNDSDLREKAMEVLNSSIINKNKRLHSEKLVLCHGYPSLSIIYQKLYELSNNKLFLEQSTIYKNKSIRCFYNSFIFYKRVRSDKYFFENSSLIIGYSGFILSLLFWSDCNNPWFKCLLL